MMPRKLFGEYLNEFYEKVKKKDKSYTQQRIANDIGVNMRTFYSWIRGRKVPRHRQIVHKIADYFSNILKENITPAVLDASIEAQIAQLKKFKEKKGRLSVPKSEAVQTQTPSQPISAILDRVINELNQIKQYTQITPGQLPKEEEELLQNYRQLSAAAKKEIFAYCKFKTQQK